MKFSRASLWDCAGLGATLGLLAVNGFSFFACLCRGEYDWAVFYAAATLSMAYWLARQLTELDEG